MLNLCKVLPSTNGPLFRENCSLAHNNFWKLWLYPLNNLKISFLENVALVKLEKKSSSVCWRRRDAGKIKPAITKFSLDIEYFPTTAPELMEKNTKSIFFKSVQNWCVTLTWKLNEANSWKIWIKSNQNKSKQMKINDVFYRFTSKA